MNTNISLKYAIKWCRVIGPAKVWDRYTNFNQSLNIFWIIFPKKYYFLIKIKFPTLINVASKLSLFNSIRMCLVINFQYSMSRQIIFRFHIKFITMWHRDKVQINFIKSSLVLTSSKVNIKVVLKFFGCNKLVKALSLAPVAYNLR